MAQEVIKTDFVGKETRQRILKKQKRPHAGHHQATAIIVMKTVKFSEIADRTNTVQLRGNLTADPVLKTVGNSKITELRIGSSRAVEIKGQPSEEVLFVDVDLRGKQAEDAAKFLKKGTPIVVEGVLKQERWEKAGQHRSKVVVTSFNVGEVQFAPKEGQEAQKLTGYPNVIPFETLKETPGAWSNSVTLKGNLTKDAEFRATPGGTKVANLRLAVSRKYKDGNQQEREEVSFFNVIQFGDKAEDAAKLTKGAPVFVEGKLNLEEWTTKGDKPEKRSEINVVAFEISQIAQNRRQGQSEEHTEEPAANRP